MDKVLTYKDIVRKLVEEIGNLTSPSLKGINTEIIIDEEKGHYVLFSLGWHNERWHYGSFVHIDVNSDGKVWLQHDGTDLSLAYELVNRGIPKTDIVLGYKSPVEREWAGEFALA
ncbi:XisI protein [Haliscomenobacter sp.]|jgi:XisI protein|uniref:XisI protein n=1 Tax=Haliscomenobacter sp. TaxID=2717303 RepID=UPI0033651798